VTELLFKLVVQYTLINYDKYFIFMKEDKVFVISKKALKAEIYFERNVSLSLSSDLFKLI